MFWVWVCLGLKLTNVGISMVVGVLLGRFWGLGMGLWGEDWFNKSGSKG